MDATPLCLRAKEILRFMLRVEICNSPTSQEENFKQMSAETQMVSPLETDFAIMQFVQTS